MVMFKVDRSNEEKIQYNFDLTSLTSNLSYLKCVCKSNSCKEKIYWHIGIIDYFQLYNFSKKAERIFK